MDSKLIECITVLSFIIIFGFVFTKILIDSEIKATKVKKSKKIKYLYQFITDDRTMINLCREALTLNDIHGFEQIFNIYLKIKELNAQETIVDIVPKFSKLLNSKSYSIINYLLKKYSQTLAAFDKTSRHGDMLHEILYQNDAHALYFFTILNDRMNTLNLKSYTTPLGEALCLLYENKINENMVHALIDLGARSISIGNHDLSLLQDNKICVTSALYSRLRNETHKPDFELYENYLALIPKKQNQ